MGRAAAGARRRNGPAAGNAPQASQALTGGFRASALAFALRLRLGDRGGSSIMRILRIVAFATIAGVTAAPAITAAQQGPNSPLLELWSDADGRCRGSGSNEACAERERIEKKLFAQGLCYGKRGEYAAGMRWHRCGSDSVGNETLARCVIADPTSTPLNVRTAPNGKLLSRIENGERVSLLDETFDRSGQQWAYIARGVDDQPLGWVFRRFIVCR